MDDETLSKSDICSYLETSDPFPIDFDHAWRWIGWAEKATGKAVLQNNFKEGFDFLGKTPKSPTGGRPRDLILLSVDCFKCIAMMAGTEKGREIRQYFLECERTLKATAINASDLPDDEEDDIPLIGRDHLGRLLATKESFRSIAPAEMLDFVERAKGLIEELVPGEFDETDKSMLACIVREAVGTVYFTGSVLTDRTIFTDEFLTIARKYMASTPNLKI